MSLLKKATMGTAYAKIGVFGFAGSGKTRTSFEIALGLAVKSKQKAIAFFDTEKGSDFMIPLASKAGVELFVHKGKSFKDMLAFLKEAQSAGIEVVIIDSISHIWRDLCDSYLKTKGRKYFTMMDWGILKGQWKDYTDLYINSPIHILMLGRAGNEYETNTNDDTGKQEMVKSGTKMKVEGETGFEPDLLIEMERVETKDGIINRAWIVKDRTDTMNGKCFDNPKFTTFKPFFDFLNIGGTHSGIPQESTTTQIFDKPDWSYEERKKRKEIAIESIQEALTLGDLEGRSADATKKRTEILLKHFGGSGKTHIENLKLEDLEAGLNSLKLELGLIKPEQHPVPVLDTTEEIN